jgi:methylenetetrahydrofolate dehydrogenase (NADP+)/methenyltetrahydrofolate cyclohydrolase
MPAKIIDGKAVAAKVKSEVALDCKVLKEQGIYPTLVVIIVGDNAASRVYVNNKKKDCLEVGIESIEYALPTETSQLELISLIEKFNADKNVSGILVQLPLPNHIDENAVINTISIQKDVDAFHPLNVGRIMIGDYDFLPCTPAGVMALLEDSGIDPAGKECVVIGRSNIVGKPQAMLLLHKNGTVTICHSRTKNLSEITRRADILIAAVGKANFVTADMVKEGAVVIDVGMNKLNDKFVGDVDFAAVSEKASYITPVPGGVGPMTRAMLLKNTVKAARLLNVVCSM